MLFLVIEQLGQVCWDEAHFGKMAGWYINRTHFFDVHPPLGKLLIAGMVQTTLLFYCVSLYWGLQGRVTGYNASLTFDKPGQNFTGHRVLGMRVGSALLGSAIVPTAYLTAWQLTASLPAAVLAASLILLDTVLHCTLQSTLIRCAAGVCQHQPVHPAGPAAHPRHLPLLPRPPQSQGCPGKAGQAVANW